MATILIVEDDAFILTIAEMMIQDWGHTTLSAVDEAEAMVFLKAPGHIDAMFTDIYLRSSVLGGCDLATHAMLLRHDLRVLYTTGNSITAAMKALFVNGGHYLCKPYTELQLQDSIEGLLAA